MLSGELGNNPLYIFPLAVYFSSFIKKKRLICIDCLFMDYIMAVYKNSFGQLLPLNTPLSAIEAYLLFCSQVPPLPRLSLPTPLTALKGVFSIFSTISSLCPIFHLITPCNHPPWQTSYPKYAPGCSKNRKQKIVPK